MSKRKTTEEFIAEAKLVHGDKYDYSATIYINGDTPVNIVCRTHGEFFQHPASHTKGYGCSACSGKLKHNKETFSLAAGLVHNNEYNYSKVEYINNSTKVNIICKFMENFSKLLMPIYLVKDVQIVMVQLTTQIKNL